MPLFPPLLAASQGLTLPRDPTRLLLACTLTTDQQGVPRRLVPLGKLEKILKTLGLLVDGDQQQGAPGDLAAARARINHTQWALWVRDVNGKPVDDARVQKVRKKLEGHCDWIGPVYVGTHPSGEQERVCPLPDVLLVSLDPKLSTAEERKVLLVLGELGFDERPARSKDLGARYLVLRDPMQHTVYDRVAEIAKRLGRAITRLDFEYMPHASPWLYEPRDPDYPSQWNMPIIQAPAAWDLTRGDPSVVIAVLDSGCDLGHPDLDTLPGVNLRDPSRDGRPVPGMSGRPDAHGTNVAGIAAAIIDNATSANGVAGVAGRCRVLPLAFDGATDAQVAAGINRAVREGARVINISMSGWWFALIGGVLGDAITAADAAGVVICASAGNGDARGIVSPARHPLVMACGGSDRTDARWSTVLPSGRRVGSHYGDEIVDGVPSGISVVAPAWDAFPSIGMPTTDMVGMEGNVALPSPAGDYWVIGGFSMTSASAPHVSGVAALLFSLHPTLTGREVRRIIERTADKVGPVPYAVADGFPNGTRNEEMGYGRLNAFHAVDFADVMIRDWNGDDGEEPSTPPAGRFWVSPDIVVRPEDDGVFAPADPLLSSQLVADEENIVYVQVVNNGPQEARNVRVNLRAVIGAAAFAYPADWTQTNATHIAPEPLAATFASVAAGASVRAVFRISAAQATELGAWSDRGQHPCLLAEVNADNDHAFAGARDGGDTLITRRNNLAQRNLQVVRRTSAPLMHESIVDVSHEEETDTELLLRLYTGVLVQQGRVTLDVDVPPDHQAPPPDGGKTPDAPCAHRLVLLDPARVASYQCGCETLLTLPAGAELSLGAPVRPRIVRAKGAEMENDRRLRITAADATFVVARPPRSRVRVTLRVESPAQFADRRYTVHLSREDAARTTTGGVTLVVEPVAG